MSHAPNPASPLRAVLGFAALSSFAAGTGTLSVFFVTSAPPYGFSAVQNYALGLLVGVTYTLGALLASPLRRALGVRGGSTRALLLGLALAMAALMLLPLRLHSDASIYLVLGLYAPLTGVFWPLVEGFVSGARGGAELRSAMGRFNALWSSALLPSFLCIPPLLARSPGAVFVAVAATHLASLPFLAFFRREPGTPAESHGPAPSGTRELLRVHRVVHAMSYLVMYALSPYLPTLLARLGLVGPGASVLAAIWLAARTLTFVGLERWHGWHGRIAVAWVGTGCVLGGFTLVLLAGTLGGLALPAVGLGLAVFGAGLATLYTAALYYAFEVGGHEGGGSHEALIGLGYSIGPAFGLVVCGLERAGLVPSAQRELALMLAITLPSLAAVLHAWRATPRRSSDAGRRRTMEGRDA